MLENTNVSFKIGENVSESNPPITPGQFIVDAASDKQCLYLDTDESTRIQLKDPTKMDVWGELSIQDIPMTGSSGVSSHSKCIIVDDPDALSHGWFAQQLVISTSPMEASNPMGSTAALQMMSMGDPNNAENHFHILSAQVQGTHDEIKYRSAIQISDIAEDMLSLRIDSASGSGDSYDDTNIMLFLHVDGYIEVESSSTINPAGVSIRGIQDVSRDTDAANKLYVDTRVSEVQQFWIDW